MHLVQVHNWSIIDNFGRLIQKSFLIFMALISLLPQAGKGESIARSWNEQLLNAIRKDIPNPPVHARNLFHLSAITYDIWAAYDDKATGYLIREKRDSATSETEIANAISRASYQFLLDRYKSSVGFIQIRKDLQGLMEQLGLPLAYSVNLASDEEKFAMQVMQTYLDFFKEDGSYENGDGITDWAFDLPWDFSYHDSGYQSVNEPYLIIGPFRTMAYPNRWQPLAFETRITQNGLEVSSLQTFLGAQWGQVIPFGLEKSDLNNNVYFDPGMPPQLGGEGDALYKTEFADVVRYSRLLDTNNGDLMDISPSGFGNNTLGTNDGEGYTVNPSTGQPYTPNLVPISDFGRVLAEFWADGPDSETPPGHWNTLANYASDHPEIIKKIGGSGEVVDDLEWDVKLYFALNGALHDAAVAAWGCKRQYDYVRPVTAIKHMGLLGQSSRPDLPSYNSGGLPLIEGQIELVTDESSQEGERHHDFQGHVGEVVIKAWVAADQENGIATSGVRWIFPSDWMPYQRDTFVTPAFPGYVSGHSVFSRSAAEVLAAFTGSPYFPGGMGSFTAKANDFLEFDEGPSVDVELQWATYFDASDQAGLSRLYGGIHVSVDDFPGRIMGSQCGKKAIKLAQHYYDGSISSRALEKIENLGIVALPNGSCKVTFQSIRGFQYQLQYSSDLEGFTSLTDPVVAEDDTTSLIAPPIPGFDYGFYKVILK